MLYFFLVRRDNTTFNKIAKPVQPLHHMPKNESVTFQEFIARTFRTKSFI